MSVGKSNLVFFDRKMLEAREFWLHALAREVDATTIPLDHPRPQKYQNGSQSLTFTVSDSLCQKINRLSGEKPLLLYTVFVAALKVVLHKMTGGKVTIVGSPVRIDGPAGNVLPIVSEIDPHLSFRELLVQLRQTLLNAYTHQSYPFSSLTRDFGLDQVDNKCPMFDVALTLSDYHGALPPMKHDISIYLTHRASLIQGQIEFNPVLHETRSIERLAQSLLTVLESALKDTTTKIRDLEILTPAERHLVLQEWNHTSVDFPHYACIHHIFETQVERSPEAVAVSFDGHALTYRQLDSRANQLAHYLQTQGVGPEVLVGLCVEPSLERVIGTLGILKAGGAFLPLDPDYPPERLSFMVEDAKTLVLVTTAALDAKISKTSARRVYFDTDTVAISQQSTRRPQSTVGSENAAYAIYTSGSTGRPKGTVCFHRGLCNLALAQIQAFAVEPSSRVLQFSSFSFDASVSEMVMTLCAGATFILDRRETLFPGDGLVRFFQEQAVTHVTLPPSVLAALPITPLPTLATLIVAGEACPAPLVQQWAPGRRFLNAYGPTEATVCTTIGVCGDRTQTPDIGHPLANMEVYILDDQQQLAVPGVSGELYIGGVGLARGYLNSPERTAEKFIPHPFSTTPGARLYRSGDRVRYLADGAIDFQGRMDNQIKLRGFRIELGEIEAVLAANPQVRETVVLCREDTPGVKCLVAYLALSDGAMPTDQDLRSYLKDRLPDYMIPQAFVVLPSLPKTPKLSIARDKLPAPKAVKRDAPLGFVGPRDTIELELAQIWEHLLEKKPIGMKDNFFELGGHSLLAVKLLSEIRQRLDKELPLSTLLQTPTIEELAIRLREQSDEMPWSAIVPVQPKGERPPLFCVHPAGGTVLCYADLAAALGPDQPIYGVQEFGLEEGHTPLHHIEEMAALYVKEIRNVQPQGPYRLAGWSFGGLAAFEIAQQLKAEGQTIATLAMFDTYAPSALAGELQALDEVDHIMSLFGDDVDLSEEYLRRLSPDDQLKHVLEKAKAVDFVPPSFTLSQVQRLMQVFIINSKAVHAYQPQTYDGQVTLFAAREKTKAIATVTNADETHGWNAIATGGVTLHWVEGNHHTMLRRPYVQALGDQLKNDLARRTTADLSTITEHVS